MSGERTHEGSARFDGDLLHAVVQELLSPFVDLLPVAGASVSVVSGSGHSTLGATDETAAQLEELQFELGEGPHWDAVRSGRELLVPDMRDRGSLWPVFAARARALEVGAVFAFPLNLGAATVGVVDLYCSTPSILSPGDVSRARSFATAAAGLAFQLAARAAGAGEPVGESAPPELRRVVHQATGMVLVQLDLTATDALARLRAHAFAAGVPLESVAQDVVAGRLSFRDEGARE